jgi:hypothetical protein
MTLLASDPPAMVSIPAPNAPTTKVAKVSNIEFVLSERTTAAPAVADLGAAGGAEAAAIDDASVRRH